MYVAGEMPKVGKGVEGGVFLSGLRKKAAGIINDNFRQ